MPDAQPDQSLHLPSLVIKNFRGIDELTIPRLGRVTLLAGKNGVGKTTVLDAVRVWAARGNHSVLFDILRERGEFFTQLIEMENLARIVVTDWQALFTQRHLSSEPTISIGSCEGNSALVIWPSAVCQSPLENSASTPVTIEGGFRLSAQLGDSDDYSVVGRRSYGSPPNQIVCNALGPNRPSDAEIERYWSEVALTIHENRALEALNLATEVSTERVALIDLAVGSENRYSSRFMAKVEDKDYPVPLRSLGDGAMRLFASALALAKSSGGFLLIDEAENGIHHSIQPKFWNMVLQTAQRNNVQVIATTHSWDCVKGFAEASAELEDVEGVLVRLERHENRLRAVEYSERNLKAAAKYGIEVR